MYNRRHPDQEGSAVSSPPRARKLAGFLCLSIYSANLVSNTLTPIRRKLEAMGHVRRARDPGDERQARVGLTEAGRALRERGLEMNRVPACGLTPEGFTQVRQAVVTLRDSLLKASAGRP